MLGISPIRNLNLSSVGITLTGVLLIWSLLRYGFLDLMPIARGVLVDTLKDAWIVLDYRERFVDLNQAAQKIINQPKDKIIGLSVERVLTEQSTLLNFIKNENERTGNLSLEINQSTYYYDMNFSPIYNRHNEKQGQLVVLRDVTRRVKLEKEHERLIAELQEALAQVKFLSGLLPICASCKNIRDDSGYWQQVEMYIEKHSDAKFSHSICPTCLKKLYPEFADEILADING